MPYEPVGVFLIDQWRQIGVNVKHEQLETRLYLAAQQSDKATYDASLDFNCDYMDEPNLQLLKYLSPSRSSLNYSGYGDPKVDELYDQQSGEFDPKKRCRHPAQDRKAGVRRCLHHPDHLVAPRHRDGQEGEGLEDHARAITSTRT